MTLKMVSVANALILKPFKEQCNLLTRVITSNDLITIYKHFEIFNSRKKSKPTYFFPEPILQAKKLHFSEVNKYALHYYAWASCSFILQRDTEYTHTPLA